MRLKRIRPVVISPDSVVGGEIATGGDKGVIVKILYLDMDNVLVDFASGIRAADPALIRAYEGHPDDAPGIFALMEPLPGAVEAFTVLSEAYDTYILSTAPWKNPSAWSDKLEWVKRHFGDKAYKRLILTHHKDLNRGDFLVDDRRKHGADRFRGELVPFGSERFPGWPSVTAYLLGKREGESRGHRWLTLEQAIAVATKAHRGVKDKAGAPYILHPLRVMHSLEGEDERIVAVLHDVLEDCQHGPWPEFLRAKLEPRLLRSLEAVTKTPEEEESGDYMAFIRRLAPDPVARRVKLADLRDNLDVRRIPVLGENDRLRVNKYLEAYRWLLEVEAGLLEAKKEGR
jgi:hypothetical protein